MTTEPRLHARIAHADALDRESGLRHVRLDVTPDAAAAGQYVKVWTRRPGTGEDALRYVSLASAPGRPAELLLMPSGSEDGADPARMPIGASLHVSARAAGSLTLAGVPARRVLWLLAAGTGLAPMRAILQQGVPERFEHVVLVHAVQREARLAFADEFRALQRTGRLRYLPMLSREQQDGMLFGRIPAAIDDGRLATVAGLPLDAEHAAALVCGSESMVAETRAALGRIGLSLEPAARVVVTEW